MIIHANAYSVKEEAAFAIVADGAKYAYKVKGHTINSAELIAVLFAINGSTGDIEYHTNCRYAEQMLEYVNGAWTRQPINNLELVNEVRNALLPNLQRFKIVFDKDSAGLTEVKKLSRAALKGPANVN